MEKESAEKTAKVIKTMTSANQPSYKEFLTTTIKEIYPKYAQKQLLKDLEKEHVVRLKKSKRELETDPSILDLSEVDEEERLSKGVIDNKQVLRHFEKSEFMKSYKYATIFELNDFDDDMLTELEEKGIIQSFQDEKYSHDIVFDEKEVKAAKPTKLNLENVIVLKFSKLLTGWSDEKKQIKYPILAIFYKHLGLLEVRLDQVKRYFQSDDYFYHKHIRFVRDWIVENVECEIEDLNLSPILDYIRRKDDVNVHSQAMALKGGGKAVLEIGENENFILPLLGELKELIKANQELFDQSPAIKTLIENFILETEETSDLPWISLLWKEENKSKGTTVKFKHNYMQQGYTLLQYYGHHSEMESMSNVAEYIIRNKKDLDRQEATEQQ